MAHRYYLRVLGKSAQYAQTGGEASFFYERLSLLVFSLRRSLFFAAVTFGALFFLFQTQFLIRAGQIPLPAGTLVQAVLLTLFFIDPGLNDRAFIQPEPIGPYQEYLFHSWPDDLLKKEAPPVRLLEIGNELSNRPMLNRIGVPLGYHPIELRYYLDAWNAAHPGSRGAARLTACPYILVRTGTRVDDNLTLVATHPQTGKTLFRRDTPAPYAYVPQQVKIVPDEKTLLEKMGAENFDPYAVSYLLPFAGKEYSRSLPQEQFRLKVLEYSDNRVKLDCRLPEDAFVVTGDVWMPGWIARLENGATLDVIRVNHAFRGLKVPKGEHILTMVYRPDSLRYGMIISLVSLGLWIVLFIRYRKTTQEAPSCTAP